MDSPQPGTGKKTQVKQKLGSPLVPLSPLLLPSSVLVAQCFPKFPLRQRERIQADLGALHRQGTALSSPAAAAAAEIERRSVFRMHEKWSGGPSHIYRATQHMRRGGMTPHALPETHSPECRESSTRRGQTPATADQISHCTRRPSCGCSHQPLCHCLSPLAALRGAGEAKTHLGALEAGGAPPPCSALPESAQLRHEAAKSQLPLPQMTPPHSLHRPPQWTPLQAGRDLEGTLRLSPHPQ
mmetsp:Transcript_14367/g.28907  ORF Transcript_14367/g.28907 Transcript_14367/m.28907 type:complete len:241 (-) Transcript_14367:63-785(-)